MSMQSYERSFERALDSITTPAVDVSVLTSAPQAALLLQGIIAFASIVIDASLENDKTRRAIRLLNTPGSLRASLLQMGAGIGNSFRVADRAMTRIKTNLDDMPDMITSILTQYATSEDDSSQLNLDMRLKSVGDKVKICSEEAKKARQSFDDTLKFIEELVQVTIATAGDNEAKLAEARSLLGKYIEQKTELEAKQISPRRRGQSEATMVKYEKTVEKVTDSWTILSATFADNADDIVKLISGAGDFAVVGRKKRSISEGDSDDEGRPQVTNETSPTGNETTTETPSVEGASQNGSKIPNTPVENLREAVEMAKDMYKFKKDIEQNLLKQEIEEKRKAIGEIEAKMAATHVDLAKFKEIIPYLSKAVKMFGEVQERWSEILTFFSNLEFVVAGPMRRNLEIFDEIVKEKTIKRTGVLRNQLVFNGFKAAAIAINVARSVGIYNQISKKYVMPLIDESARMLTISEEKAEWELSHLESKIQEITEESHRFLDEKLKEAEKETVNQMMRCKDGFFAALSHSGSRPRVRG